jgi:endonuclease-3 related protein
MDKRESRLRETLNQKREYRNPKQIRIIKSQKHFGRWHFRNSELFRPSRFQFRNWLPGEPAQLRASTNTRKALQELYQLLLKAYEPQHWWPGDTPFEVIVGAILTQSTSWANVASAIRNLKAAGELSPEGLRRFTQDELATLVRPSGYYTVKAKKLTAMLAWLEQHNDDLDAVFAEDVHQLREELLGIYGVGEETADSILLYAAGKPVFVIDAYTRRIIDRIGIRPSGSGYADYQRLFTEHLSQDAAMFNEYHALLVEHGKRTCRKTPLCSQCRLLDICDYGLSCQTPGTKARCP